MFSRYGSLVRPALFLLLGSCLVGFSSSSLASQKNTPVKKSTSTADHSKFDELKKTPEPAIY